MGTPFKYGLRPVSLRRKRWIREVMTCTPATQLPNVDSRRGEKKNKSTSLLIVEESELEIEREGKKGEKGEKTTTKK